MTKNTRWVVKVGSQLLLDDAQGINQAMITRLVAQIAELKRQEIDVVLVSSGAIAAGLHRLRQPQRPTVLSDLQAAAAIGQMALTQTYQKAFSEHALVAGQILLTHDDAQQRARYLNIKSTFDALFRVNAVPIVNENDSIAFDEIRFGDNDNLGALVANLVNAERYVILTDETGLFDKDPKAHADAQLIREARADDKRLFAFVGKSKTVLGSGGMFTKLQAARKAANSGTSTVITSGRHENILVHILDNDYDGTLLTATHGSHALTAKKQWLAGQVITKGQVQIDAGAEKALSDSGNSLLFVGVTAVSGEFQRGEIIAIANLQDDIIGYGISNYGAEEAQKLIGVHSEKISEVLGYRLERHLIHCDNFVMN